MTLKETVFHELETADDLLLEDLLQMIRSRRTLKPTVTITDAIAELRRNMSPEELDPNAEDICKNDRDAVDRTRSLLSSGSSSSRFYATKS